MNKEKLTAWGFVIIFFILCIIPSVGMLFYHSALAENRTLSEKPVFWTEEGKWNQDFFQELQTYVSEHFAFRGELVEADSLIKYQVLRTPSDDQVVIGKKGWLYFEQTLADYAGVTLSDEEIDTIADTLTEVTQYVERMGKQPLFVIVPNKNSIYPEYMPARFGDEAERRNLTLLQQCMTDQEIPFVDAYQLLLAHKDTDALYLQEDTHWNYTGARLVLNEIYTALGYAEQYSLTGYTVAENHEPDLYKILFPSTEHFEAQHIYEDNKPYDYVGRLHSLDDITIRTTSAAQNGKSILVYRDSFGRAMIPFMGGSFSQAVFNRSTPYDLSLIEKTECDYVLFEIVERNLQDLGQMIVPK